MARGQQRHGANQLIKAAPDDTEVNWDEMDVQVRWDGRHITLPVDAKTGAKMEYEPAINTLERIRDQENQAYDVNELVKGGPWDALAATYKAMQEVFGAVTQHGIPSFFGEINPDMLTVHMGPDHEDVIQVPVGLMKVVTSFNDKDKPTTDFFLKLDEKGCRIQGQLRKKEREMIVRVVTAARRILETNSIYRGKALDLNVGDDGKLDLSEQPGFLDLRRVREDDVIHTEETDLMIRTSIWGPLKNTDACRRNKISLKRGNLLVGKYGTGKSLTARVSAKVAIDNGWTFLNIKSVDGLKAAIELAKIYQPCMIFAEDVDRATSDRGDEAVNRLVNLMDGMVGKNDEIMIVLTTNYVDRIDKAFMRPGRLDAVIRIDPPDHNTVGRLIRHYADASLVVEEDIEKVSHAASGQIPATIREIVDRAKLHMLVEGRNTISGDNLYAAFLSMKYHLDLLNEDPKVETPAERLYNTFSDMFATTLARFNSEDDEEFTQQIEKMEQRIGRKLIDIERSADTAAAASSYAAASSMMGRRRGNGHMHDDF